VKYDVEQALGDVKSQHCVMLYNVQALIDVVELSLVEVELVPSDVELALIDVVELSLVEAELVVSGVELALGDVVEPSLVKAGIVRSAVELALVG